MENAKYLNAQITIMFWVSAKDAMLEIMFLKASVEKMINNAKSIFGVIIKKSVEGADLQAIFYQKLTHAY